jgi:hypothetical protein
MVRAAEPEAKMTAIEDSTTAVENSKKSRAIFGRAEGFVYFRSIRHRSPIWSVTRGLVVNLSTGGAFFS